MLWPEHAGALAWLVRQGLAEKDADVWLRAAGSRPADALALARSGRSCEAWSALPRAIARAEVAALVGLTPPQAVQVLQQLCHDLLALRVGAEPRYFAATDLPKPAELPGVAALTRWARALAQEARHAEHPFNASLMLQALVSQAYETVHSRH